MMYRSIVEKFAIQGIVTDMVPLGSGHIHKTFLLQTRPGDTYDYVLQQINTSVFKDPEAVMHNLEIVTHHIRKKSSYVPSRGYLTPVKTIHGDLACYDLEKQPWRCFVYIDDHKSYDRATNVNLCYEGGKAYGKFLKLLSDLPAHCLKTTIPDFHNMELRIAQLESACKDGLKERIVEADHEIEAIRKKYDEMLLIHKYGADGCIPIRIVHHDTKINNVLFDSANKGLCVIDLDTVMPGFVHDDFGDSIRTFTNTGDEDDPELNRISMNIHFFEAYANGYLEETADDLSLQEKQLLALSAKAMTFMQTIRFLADFLNGDTYYPVRHASHNLQRARAQLRLLKSMEDQFDTMKTIINRLT